MTYNLFEQYPTVSNQIATLIECRPGDRLTLNDIWQALDNPAQHGPQTMAGVIKLVELTFATKPKDYNGMPIWYNLGLVSRRYADEMEQVSLGDQVEALVTRAPCSAKGGLSLGKLLTALTKYQHDTKQKTHFSSRAVSKAVKALFNVQSKSSNSQTIFPGLQLKCDISADSSDSEPAT